MKDEEDAFTIEDWNEFKSAKTYAEQFEILLKHSQKNQKIIEIRPANKSQVKSGKIFREFLREKERKTKKPFGADGGRNG